MFKHVGKWSSNMVNLLMPKIFQCMMSINVWNWFKMAIHPRSKICLAHPTYQSASRRYCFHGIEHMEPATQSRAQMKTPLSRITSCLYWIHSSLTLNTQHPLHVKKADYSTVHNATKYTLLNLEAKSCKQQHRSATDLIKIGKYSKDTIDAAEAKGFRGLQLVGLISSGEHVDAYLIAHDHDYIYTLYRLYTFHIPIDRIDWRIEQAKGEQADSRITTSWNISYSYGIAWPKSEKIAQHADLASVQSSQAKVVLDFYILIATRMIQLIRQNPHILYSLVICFFFIAINLSK